MKYLLPLFIMILSLSCTQHNNVQKESKDDIKLYDYDVEEKIKSLGIDLPEANIPVANYVNAVTTGDLVYLAGKGPKQANGEYIKGKVVTDVTIEDAYKAARLIGIAQLGALKDEIGDLNKVVRIVKVMGMVNAEPGFGDQPEVINGFSDLMVEVFGERGEHARAAVGMSSLPRNIVCEIDMVVEIGK
ncbi:MAG: RidA family protein [Bacteroidia bacterium]|nr:RidA family protein [Bacteroidia bacterium]